MFQTKFAVTSGGVKALLHVAVPYVEAQQPLRMMGIAPSGFQEAGLWKNGMMDGDRQRAVPRTMQTEWRRFL
jgi:hypothetical protein